LKWTAVGTGVYLKKGLLRLLDDAFSQLIHIELLLKRAIRLKWVASDKTDQEGGKPSS